jgi:hypothetical protein
LSALLLGYMSPSAVASMSGPTPFEHEHHSDHAGASSGMSVTLAEPRPRCHRELVSASHGVFAGARLTTSRLTPQASRVLVLHEIRDLRNGIGAPLLT